jgi:hypothetical protein
MTSIGEDGASTVSTVRERIDQNFESSGRMDFKV